MFRSAPPIASTEEEYSTRSLSARSDPYLAGSTYPQESREFAGVTHRRAYGGLWGWVLRQGGEFIVRGVKSLSGGGFTVRAQGGSVVR
eukprot:696547-Prorocentrum_minimum.AAC.1